MALAFRPRIVYNSITTDYSIPQRFWRYKSHNVGGSAESASGVLESYVVRTASIAVVTLRFTETEWNTIVRPWLDWAQQNQGTAFTFRFDQTDAGTAYSVYLLKPSAGEPIEPERGEATGTYELEVELRASSPSTFTTVAY